MIVILAGLLVFRRTKNTKKALLAALIAFVVVWGLSFVADQFME